MDSESEEDNLKEGLTNVFVIEGRCVPTDDACRVLCSNLYTRLICSTTSYS